MERRRQMGDVGIVAQRYELVLFGSHQRLELQPWQPETQRTARVPIPVEEGHLVHDEARGADAGRRQGARARQGLAEGRAGAGGVDDRAHRSDRQRQGRAGLYADAPSQAGGGSELYYDNIKVYKNK